MTPQTDSLWFTELCEEGGSALSMQIREKLHDEKTGFQHIEIYSTTHFGNLMVIDGFVMLTSLDNFLYHEMMSHPALFTQSAAAIAVRCAKSSNIQAYNRSCR